MFESQRFRAAIEEASQLAATHAAWSLPVDVVSLARRLGVSEITGAAIASDGYIGYTLDGSCVIRYRFDHPEQRKRFTIAHEIGHLLLAKNGAAPRRARYRDQVCDDEELAANRLAAEILMPTALYEAALHELAARGFRSRWRSVRQLKRAFGVAESAAALRLLELPNVIAVLFRLCVRGTATKYPYDFSHAHRVSLDFSIAECEAQIRRDYRNGLQYHRIRAVCDGCRTEITCEGEIRRLCADQNEEQYWALGWQLL